MISFQICIIEFVGGAMMHKVMCNDIQFDVISEYFLYSFAENLVNLQCPGNFKFVQKQLDLSQM